MAFRVESAVQSSFNKTAGKGATRLGNWQEEESLREFTGYHRQANFKEDAFHRTQDRVISHSDAQDAKDYKSSTIALHAKPVSHAEYRAVKKLGPRAEQKLQEMKQLIQEEEDEKERRDMQRKQKGEYSTVTKVSYTNYDPELTRTANPRVGTMRTTLQDPMGKTLSQQMVEDRAQLEKADYTKQEAITLYSSKIRSGQPFEGTTAAPGKNPFGRSSRFTNDLKDGGKVHAEGSDRGGLAPVGLGPNPMQRTVVDRVRAKILDRVGRSENRTSFRALSRAFRRFDDSGNQKLSAIELSDGFAEMGLDLSDQEVATVVDVFDRDRDGSVSLEEFLRFVRGVMNPRRQELVNLAYDVLDSNDDGRVTLDDIRQAYDASQHPEVLKGRMTEEQVLVQFMDQWDTDKKDGYVSREEFLEYYADLSCSIDDDDYWELMIRNAWHISGGKGWSANTSCRRVLVVHFDGSQEIVEIKNDIGIKADDIEEMKRRLELQGVSDIERIELAG